LIRLGQEIEPSFPDYEADAPTTLQAPVEKIHNTATDINFTYFP